MTNAMGETAMLTKIQATYNLDNLDFTMPPILQLIEDIIYNSDMSSGFALERPMFQYEAIGPMHQSLAYKINVISCEILGSCNRYQDSNEAVLSMFSALSTLSWIAKGVVALAAFAINYGEFRLVVEQRSTDHTAKLLASLENVPEDFHKEGLYKKIAELAKAALRLVTYLWSVKYLYAKCNNSTAPITEFSAKLHIAIYWIIQSIVTCQSIITSLASTGFECISLTAEEWELDYLTKKVTEVYQKIESETSEKLLSLFPQDEITVLTKLICSEDHMRMTLIDGDTKIPQKVELLENKKVLLYISNLDPHNDEIETVKRVHTQFKDVQFVWLPVLDKSQDWNEETFETKRKLMPWLVVRKSQFLDGTIIKFMENVWQFKKRSIIVAFDDKGIVVNNNALPMILIWGSQASPFTIDKEKQLWNSQTWGLELLLNLQESTPASNDLETINKWIKDKKDYMCLYGGDTEWINKFKTKMEVTAQSLDISWDDMKMLNIKDLSSLGWIIWARIEAMFLSRSKPGIISSDKEQKSDPILEGALTMCGFHCSRRDWAIISKGPNGLMAKALGDVMLNCLNKRNAGEWKKNGFVESLNACILNECETLHFLPTFPKIPESRVCHCSRPMRKSVTFRCWGDRKTQTTNPTAG